MPSSRSGATRSESRPEDMCCCSLHGLALPFNVYTTAAFPGWSFLRVNLEFVPLCFSLSLSFFASVDGCFPWSEVGPFLAAYPFP